MQLIEPEWAVPERVNAVTTTRHSGVSLPPYDSFNLAIHVGDDFDAVMQNRQTLTQELSFSVEPFWLEQQHTTNAVEWTEGLLKPPVADASWTNSPGQPLVIMTADCLPILITNRQGSLVATIHAGWKGLANGVVTKTLQQLPELPENLIVWVGPAISQDFFEVGEEVVRAFEDKPFETSSLFQATKLAKWMADLPGLVKLELESLGVKQITLSGLCTYRQADLFYSYRRDGQTGRIASLIWLT